MEIMAIMEKILN